MSKHFGLKAVVSFLAVVSFALPLLGCSPTQQPSATAGPAQGQAQPQSQSTAVPATQVGAQTSTGSAAPKLSGQGKTIGVALAGLAHPFMVEMKYGAEAACKQYGCKVVVVDGQDKSATQLSQVEDLITQKVDALILNPTDGKVLTQAVVDANKANIPVVTVDRTTDGGDVASFVASDSYRHGALVALYITEKLGQKGNIAVLEGIPGTSSSDQTGQGFDAVMKLYPNVKIVARQTAQFARNQGMTVTENMLQAHPDIQAIVAYNDEMALGALEAVKAAGKAKKILIIGGDAQPDAIQAIKSGDMTATVSQLPYEMTVIGVENALKVISGGTVDKFIASPNPLISVQNAEYTMGVDDFVKKYTPYAHTGQ